MKTIKKILIATILSILIFLSTSFISVFLQLNTPLNRQIDSNLNIGFPLIYYNQFLVDLPIPNSSWNLKNLFFDFIFVYVIILGFSLMKFKHQKNG